MNKLFTLFALAILSFASSASIIQVSTVNALGNNILTEDFEDAEYLSNVSFSAPSSVVRARSTVYAAGVTPSGNFGLIPNSFPEIITINFANAVSNVGLFFGNDDTCCSSGFSAYMDIFSGATLLGTIDVVANMNDAADQLLAFTSNEMVTSVDVRYGSGQDVSLYVYIDDVMFSSATQVSAPTSIILFLGFAMALVGMRKS